MPQPVSSLGRKIGIHIGNNVDSPSVHRPNLALAAMNVVAEWSILESFFSDLFMQMLGANPRPAAAMYYALSGEASKKAALRAIAQTVLSMEEQDVFEAILSLFTSVAKDRNKIAHWIWGYSSDLPDAVLLWDPAAKANWDIAYHEYQHASERFVRDGREGKQPDSATDPTPPKFSTDGIYIFRARDFSDISSRVQRLMGFVTSFRFVLMRSHPVNEDGEVFAQLSSEPEVRAFLDRLDQRRKTAQATHQQPPEPPEIP